MATAQTMGPDQGADDGMAPVVTAQTRGNKKRLIIGGVVASLIFGGVGIAYATGLIGRLTGTNAEARAADVTVPGSVDIPEIVANLNAGPHRTSFVRVKARLELSSKSDEAAVQVLQPRMQDLFQTYLRDMRPDELRGSAGTYRLREELIARANIALAPARVTGILFVELLIQ